MVLILILGYLVGGIPFGVLVAKLFRLPDPRYIGSGNIGATNMLRTGNKKAALLTLLLDMLKGAVVVIIGYYWSLVPVEPSATCQELSLAMDAGSCRGIPNVYYAAIGVLAAAIGHMYSPFLKLKGGKGVATLFGATLAFSWPVAMASLFVWLITVFITRLVSLGSVLALAIAPLVAWLRVDGSSALILAIAAAIAIWKHRENIKRLRKGFEPRISFGKGDKQ